jgi:hypothetical protein
MPVVLRAQGIRIAPLYGCRVQLSTSAMAPLSWSPGGAAGRPSRPTAETTLTSKAHPADLSNPNSPLMRANLGTGDHWWILRSHV